MKNDAVLAEKVKNTKTNVVQPRSPARKASRNVSYADPSIKDYEKQAKDLKRKAEAAELRKKHLTREEQQLWLALTDFKHGKVYAKPEFDAPQ